MQLHKSQKCVLYFNVIYVIAYAVFLVVTDLVGLWALIIGEFLISVFLLCTGLYAIKKEKPRWLIPCFVVWICLTIWNAYGSCTDFVTEDYEHELELLLFDVFYFILCVWFIYIIFRCDEYLNAKKQGNGLPMFFTNKNNDDDAMPFAVEENI